MRAERAFDPPEQDSTSLESDALTLLARTILRDYRGRIALVSSFGAESIVLLDMVATISPSTPVLLNETGMLFPETLEYQREVSAKLGLSNVQLVRPTRQRLTAVDPDEPLKRALAPFDAWITGRKRFQNSLRAELEEIEQDDDGKMKVNPLARWTATDIAAYLDRHALPRHPLVAQGYPSIGCEPCTSRVADGEDPRAGRWRGSDKTECGIHYVEGQFIGGGGI